MIRQENAQWDLKFISRPRGLVGTNYHSQEYLYDDSAGEGISIYVVDFGANILHPEYTGMVGSIKWLWPGQDLWGILPMTSFRDWYPAKADPYNHGTCMMSKMAGPEYGVAKKANIVVVKLVYNGRERRIMPASLMNAIALIKQDIEDKAEQGNSITGKVVVNFSIGLKWDPNNEVERNWIEQLRQGISTLLQLDAVVVISSGNADVTTPMKYNHIIFTETELTSIGLRKRFKCS